MPENKIIPIQIPALGYTTPLTDIGSGYAKGIESAGKSIGGAITGLFGGIDAQGNVTHGILEQNSTANDTLGFLKDQGILSEDAYNSVMSKGLGARQAIVGAYMGQFQTNMKTQVEQANKLAQIRETGAQQLAERQMAEEAANKRAAELAAIERQKMLLDPKNRPIKIVE